MMIKNTSIYSFLLLLIICFSLTSSCVQTSDIEKANTVANDTIIPAVVNNALIEYTDSGKRLARIKAPLLERYGGKNPYTEMKKGLDAVFFDALGNQESTLTAQYGRSDEIEKEILVKNNVELKNIKGDKLNTEKLIWKQSTGKIVTDAFVKITKQDEVIYGEGLESNQEFTQYKIFKISGIVKVNENNKDTAR